MDFVKVDSILSNLGRTTGDPLLFESTYVVQVVEQEIPRLFGEKATGQVSAKSFKNGELVFGVCSSVWATEIRLSEMRLKEIINARLNKELIFSIRTRVIV
jgi:hypothetical protein